MEQVVEAIGLLTESAAKVYNSEFDSLEEFLHRSKEQGSFSEQLLEKAAKIAVKMHV